MEPYDFSRIELHDPDSPKILIVPRRGSAPCKSSSLVIMVELHLPSFSEISEQEVSRRGSSV